MKSRNIFFHGTWPQYLEGIAKHGLRWDCLAERRIGKPHSGFFGKGVYLTRNYRTAIDYGPCMLRVTLVPGVRLLDITANPDPGILRNIRKKYGREALTARPWRVLPANKSWTREEVQALARHHYRRAVDSLPHATQRELDALWQMVQMCKSLLTRFGYHGFGDSESSLGIVLFDDSLIESTEFIGTIPRYLQSPANYEKVSEEDALEFIAMADGREKTLKAIRAGVEPTLIHSTWEVENLRPWLLEDQDWIRHHELEKIEELAEFRAEILEETRRDKILKRYWNPRNTQHQPEHQHGDGKSRGEENG